MVAFIATFFLAGCVSPPMGIPPSGVSPGFLFSDVNYPTQRDSITKFKVNRNDIVILGPVTAKGESQCILALWAKGDNGYGNLMKAAKGAYPNADGVVDVQWDTKYSNLCIPCCYVLVPIMFKATSTGEGQAFMFKK
ncbi:MAG: hypothetical protein WCI03_08615 [bacterium]